MYAGAQAGVSSSGPGWSVSQPTACEHNSDIGLTSSLLGVLHGLVNAYKAPPRVEVAQVPALLLI
jgi:hypothetical protein